MAKYNLSDLMEIVKTLRGDNGCPWDKAQTHETLKSCLLEETYEVIDAIDQKNRESLVEELGDLLLQVVFHSDLADENGDFNFEDVVDGVSRKMIRRHPHIFSDVKVEGQKDVLKNWEAIKNDENSIETETESMRNIPKIMPALLRAYKVQQKAARVGFDWEDAKGAMDKLYEEVDELKEVYKGENRDKIIEELGDVLFAAVNVARFTNVDPELALQAATEKFVNRFDYIERSVLKLDRNLQEMTLNDLDKLWEKCKCHEKKKKSSK